MTVGWGKKETQFHGSEGKAAAKAKPSVLLKTELDDGLPRITWRGDGTLFAVSFVSANNNNIRLFKVFNREGVLQYTSEPTNGLEENLSWKPSGNLIAATQRLPNKHVVAFFEKNGLRHREFSLPFESNEIVVKELLWSHDSDVLAVWCEDSKNGDTQVQLWTENNYHWYLKQTIPFSKENPLIYLTWSAAFGFGKKLLVLTKEKLLTYSFRWVVNYSRGSNETSKALVAVIDGDKALLTGFRAGVVPPPMAHQTLQINEPMNEVVFAPETESKDCWINSNCFFTVLHDNKLAFYEHSTDSQCIEFKHVKSYNIEWESEKPISDSVPYSMHHFLWFKENTILSCAPANADSYLCIIHSEGNNREKNGRLVIRETHIIAGVIEHIVSSPDSETAYIVADGSVLRYNEEEGVTPTEIQLTDPCHQVQVIEVRNKHVVISLSDRYRLYVDGREIANNITSFFVHTEFLLVTTLQHTLICIALESIEFEKLTMQDLTVKPWEAGDNEKSAPGLSVRRIERGSKLIIAVPKDNRTILQMPRGNLETIQPRALSLHVIATHLNALNYYSAFDLIRKQRINLNLIYDHDPILFTENASKFVNDIKNPNWLSLFLSELQEQDVTTTMYASCYPRRSQENPNSIADAKQEPNNKVENICELLRNIMESREDADRLLLPILTSLVKKHETKDLEAALEKVKGVKKMEDKNENKLQSSSEEALKYLLYLVDVNVLFDVALGMYDFDLAMFVAAKSQKDPMEYIPFLNDMKKLEENYMRYSIDKHLKRYESALNHIARCENKFNECVSLIQSKNLYSKALKLFAPESSEYKVVARVYGESLMTRRNYHEAAIMFCRSRELELALNAYKLAGNWQEAIVVANQMKLSPTDLCSLYEDLVARLKEDRRYREAAVILMDHLHEHEDAVAVLCDGKLWQDALRVAYHSQRMDIIETHIKPGVEEHADYMISRMNKNREDFAKFKARLEVVRAEKLMRQMQNLYDDDKDYDVITGRGDSDLFSDTSSIVGSVSSRGSQSSRSSGRSYRSSKNRRKQERKVLKLKEGSVFEDLALIRALHQIVVETYAQRDEAKLVTGMLMQFYKDDCAEKLQNLLDDFLTAIEASKSKIWIEQLENSSADTRQQAEWAVSRQGQSDIPHSLLEPHLRYAPIASPIAWQLDVLSSNPKTVLSS